MELREKFEAADADGGDSLDQKEVSNSLIIIPTYVTVPGLIQRCDWEGDVGQGVQPAIYENRRWLQRQCWVERVYELHVTWEPNSQ